MTFDPLATRLGTTPKLIPSRPAGQSNYEPPHRRALHRKQAAENALREVLASAAEYPRRSAWWTAVHSACRDLRAARAAYHEAWLGFCVGRAVVAVAAE